MQNLILERREQLLSLIQFSRIALFEKFLKNYIQTEKNIYIMMLSINDVVTGCVALKWWKLNGSEGW